LEGHLGGTMPVYYRLINYLFDFKKETLVLLQNGSKNLSFVHVSIQGTEQELVKSQRMKICAF
jgi:hypothetical protein